MTFHTCQFCDGRYPCETTEEVSEGVYRCECKSVDECPGCSEHGACERCGQAPAGDERNLFMCSACAEATEDSRNEKAHEAMLSDYYGGSGPQSDRERFDVDSMNKVRR